MLIQNRNMYRCTYCEKRFSGSRELTQHTKDRHKIDDSNPALASKPVQGAKNGKTVSCIHCNKSFSTATELSQHQRDKHKIDPPKDRSKTPPTCSVCSSHFSTPAALHQHIQDKHKQGLNSNVPKASLVKSLAGSSKEFKCSSCSKILLSSSQLAQHFHDKHSQSNTKGQTSKLTVAVKSDKMRKQEEIALKRNERKKIIDDYYAKKVDVDKDKKKISVRLVNETLSKIMCHVNRQQGGDIYCPNHVKAGSFPVNTKIGKPDEFDTNICLKICQQDIKVSRGKTIHYSLGEVAHAANMNINYEVNTTDSGVKVPDSYAVVSTTSGKIPPELLHGNDIVPRMIRYDFYQKIKSALEQLRLTYVHLSRSAHGPALTLTIHPSQRYNIQHHISVDITISLPCNIPIAKWPRPETRHAFRAALIKDVKETGTHLVPKKDEAWAISYSKAERALFSRVDEGNGCRKIVYKMLKKYMQSCKSGSRSGLPGLSSHILKTQILWSCERHASNPEFWHYNNRDLCLIETLGDLERTLRRRHLPDYFDTSVDVLSGKDVTVCSELANHLREKRLKLEF